jgi:hypothetical protein
MVPRMKLFADFSPPPAVENCRQKKLINKFSTLRTRRLVYDTNIMMNNTWPVSLIPTWQMQRHADRARLIAELDGMAQDRERQSRQEMLAQRNAMDLAAQNVATPAQQIIRESHHTQPIYIPTHQVPAQENHPAMMRQMGLTMQQLFWAQQAPAQR